MCELAILGPEEASAEELANFAFRIYRRQNDALGLVGVLEEDEEFAFLTFKSIDPKVENVESFIEGVQEEDDSTMLVIHGRMATHGERSVKGAHPINIDCPECDVEMVLHNGVVIQHERMRSDHKQLGHDYTTDVDSEVIAHAHGAVPTDFDDTMNRKFSREPAFILLNEDAIYTWASPRYHLDGSGLMTKRNREYGPDEDSQSYRQVIYQPGGGE